MCRGVHTRPQGEHTYKGRFRHVDVRLDAPTQVHRAYTRKRAGAGTWMHVQTRTHTFKRHTNRKDRYRHVEVRADVYTNVHLAYTPKRAVTDTWMNV